MKRRFLLGGSIAFLLVVIAVTTLATHAWSSPAAQTPTGQQHASQATGTDTPQNKKASLIPAANLSFPNHQMPTPTPTPQPTVQPTSPPPDTQPTPASAQQPAGNSGGMTAEEQSLAEQLFAQINADRAANGLPAYSWSDQLVNSAYKHDQRMNQPDCGMSHQCPGEPELGTRISDEGVSWMACGENVGYASGYGNRWQAVLAIHQGMMNEQPPNDGHRRNLLSQSFHRVGVAIYIAGDTVWLTEDFAN